MYNFDPYNTFALSRHRIDNVKKDLVSLAKLNKLNPIQAAENSHPDFKLYALTDKHVDLPIFYHPIVIKDPEEIVVIDLRLYTNKITVSQEGKVVNTFFIPEIQFLLFYGGLVGLWRREPSLFMRYNLLGKTYAQYIAENMTKRLGLDPIIGLRVTALFHAYYSLKMTGTDVLGSQESLIGLQLKLSRSSGLDPALYKEVMTGLTSDITSDINKLLAFMEGKEWTPRLKGFKYGQFVNLLSRGWFGGGNPVEQMVTALEFPPAFIAMCLLASINTYYQKSLVGQTLKRIGRGSDIETLKVGLLNDLKIPMDL